PEIFKRGGEPAASGSLEPRSRDRLETQSRAPRPGRPLLTFQPLSNRTDQVIVGKLIMRFVRTCHRARSGTGIARRGPFESGGRDTGETVTEACYKLGNPQGAAGVPRRGSQVSTGAGAAANH